MISLYVQSHLKDTYPFIENSWPTLKATAVFVIGHPNGWEGAQQASIRKAAIAAGLVRDSRECYSRVKLVTEGEASVHYCFQAGVMKSVGISLANGA